jgi:hypothetical protein
MSVRVLFPALAVALMAGPPAAAQQAPAWLVPGQEYFGHGMQDSGSGWSIHIVVTAPDLLLISYPSIPCGGVLRRVGQSGTTVSFVETITEWPESCINGGTVELEPLLPGALRFSWRNGSSEAEGTVVALPAAQLS